MKKTEMIEAIDKLIGKYARGQNYESICPLCILAGERNSRRQPNCTLCINSVFPAAPSRKGRTKAKYNCLQRKELYYLSWYNKSHYYNLARYWTSVKHFLSSLQEEIDINDIKESILKLAEPFKK